MLGGPGAGDGKLEWTTPRLEVFGKVEDVTRQLSVKLFTGTDAADQLEFASADSEVTFSTGSVQPTPP